MAGVVRKIIHTTGAPKAIGPYSQAVAVDNTMYLSGQLGVDPATGKLVEGVEEQCHQIMKNIGKILETQDADYTNVVKTTILMRSMGDYKKINEVYAKYFTSTPPARAAFQVAGLPMDGLLEIECIAVLGKITDQPSETNVN